MPPSNNTVLLQALEVQADALSCAVSKNEFPVLLQPLAARRRVSSVEFCPLLVDAMLTTHPTGFRILFNSNGDEPSKLSKQFASETKARPLPPRLRFSLAHEIAHTLFYDLGEGAPIIAKKFRSGGGRTALEHLERSCNRIAAHLLLPTPMLAKSIRALKNYEPESFLELAGQAGVSVEVLVRRLADQSSLLSGRYFRGCIVLAKQRDGETFVSAIAKPSNLAIARDLRLMKAGEGWQLTKGNGEAIHPESLPATSTEELLMETAHGTKSTAPYKIAIADAGSFKNEKSFLLVFEQIET